MALGEDHRRRIRPQAGFDDFPRIHGGLRQRASEQLFAGDHAMLGVQPEADEDFMLAARDREPQIVAHRARRGEGAGRAHAVLQAAAREFHRRLELRALRGPEALDVAEVRCEQSGDVPEPLQQVTAELHGALAGQAGAQDHREQLRVA